MLAVNEKYYLVIILDNDKWVGSILFKQHINNDNASHSLIFSAILFFYCKICII